MKSLRLVPLAVGLLLLTVAASTNAAAAVRVSDSGWFWGSPQPHGVSLNDAEFIGRRGYAVGDNGAVMRSDDGGATWSGLAGGGPSLRGGSLSKVDAVTTNTFVAPTADPCTLRRSDDAGRTFRRLRLVPRGTRCPGPIVSFSFPSSGVGYAVLAAGIVFRTTDGGASFTRRTPLPGTPVSGGDETSELKVHFTSPTTGLAISDATSAGRIHRTVDGGGTWTQVRFEPNGLRGIDFPDPLNGWVVGRGGVILRTINGGANWSRPPLVGTATASEAFSEVACADLQTCLFGRASTFPLRTTNGGATLTSVGGSALPGSEVLDFASTGRAVALGETGTTAISDDNGASFRRLDRRLPGGLSSLRATSPQLAVAFGDPGQLSLTQDGGRSWRFVGVPTNVDPTDASFATPAVGYVLEEGGTILRTRNGGEDWQDAAGVPASALLARSPTLVLVAGRGGVRRSTDGATGFRRMGVRALRGTRLSQLDSAGPAVFAFGGRALARSTNDGRTWRRIRRPTRTDIVDADFVNARIGFVIAETRSVGNRLYRTTNAGRSWRWVQSVGTRELFSVSAASPRSGYVDADDDTARTLRTSDGGRTWHPQHVAGDTITLGGIAATGPGTALLLNTAGNLFATTTGGEALGASALTLRSSRRRLRRAARVTLSGRLTPRVADEQIVIASLVRGRWRRTTVDTEPDGSFRLRLRVRRTTRFVAQWDGDGFSHGAGTRPVTVRVRR